MLLASSALADGTIEGRVSDYTGSVYFDGAIVTVVGQSVETVTEDGGRFRITGLPPGDYELEVSYVGAEPVVQKVTVVDDLVTQAPVRIGQQVELIENIIVVGQFAGALNAINQMRSADNLVSVVTSDSIGQFADENVSEALQRVSSVFIERDQGEGRFVGVRGIDPRLNAASINGLNVRAPQSDRRNVALDVIPSDLVESLEVTKSLTPDKDGDAIGGTINIKSLTAFDRKGMSYKLQGQSYYNAMEEDDVQVAPVAFDEDYHNLLPSNNLRYKPRKDLILRAAYTQSIARPSFGDLTPTANTIEIEEDDDEIALQAESGNPALEPYKSQNFDFSIEYYPNNLGILSVGIFYKRIDDVIYQADVSSIMDPSDYAGNIPVTDIEVFQPLNGESADLRGLEFGWTRHLSELPPPFDGLILTANATFTHSEADLGLGEGGERSSDSYLPLQADRVANLVIGYEKNGWSLRLSSAYVSERIAGIDLENENNDLYEDAHHQIDLTVKYDFSERFQVYFNVINLNEEPNYRFYGSTRYNAQFDEIGRSYVLGLTYGNF